MREIKFRYRISSKVEVGDFIVASIPTEIFRVFTLVDIENGQVKKWCKQNKGEVIGRDIYVGFKDKDGKEIEVYEGDIVWCKLNRGHKGGNFPVTWSNICAHWRVYCTELYQAKDIRVVGNIYENPELLKGKNE